MLLDDRMAPWLPSESLKRFEAFVQGQTPADVPWQPVTDYSFEHRREVEGPRPQLIKEVFEPKVVCDAGCGPDGHLVRLLREIGVNAIGFDPQVKDNPFARYLMRASLFDKMDGVACADLVVCREVLEHLTVRELTIAVRALVLLSSKYIYLTTRFNHQPSDLLDVLGSDALDPTHITLMPRDLLRLLFVLHGCKSRLDLEAKMDWGPVGRSMVFEVPA